MKPLKLDNVESVVQAAWFAQSVFSVNGHAVFTKANEEFQDFKDRCEKTMMSLFPWKELKINAQNSKREVIAVLSV